MPVEESGNLILMIDALETAEGNAVFAKKHFATLEKWAAYLSEKGIDPENQLSTDDFAGHLAHNTNLSSKAIEALAAFAQIACATGHPDAAKRYRTLIKPLRAKWESRAREPAALRLQASRTDLRADGFDGCQIDVTVVDAKGREAVRTFHPTVPAQAEAVADLMVEYYRLGFARKPEHMGWNANEEGHSPRRAQPCGGRR